jgi:hypothetical protein
MRFNRNAVFFAAGGIAAALLLAGAAQAITDTSFNYSKAQVGYLTVHGMAFIPADTNAADNYSIDQAGAHSTAITGGICLHAPAEFPDGAKIAAQVIWYKGEGSLILYRNVLSTGAWQQVIGTGFSDLSGNRKFVTGTADSTIAVVDHSQYSYSFELCLNNTNTNSLFSAVRVRYTYNNAGD